jgi:CheY-like chemotaxis protein
MMTKTCLLVTDDPDDHQAFSEAFSEISSQAIVLIILDSEKALELLTSKKHVPDYLFLDLSMHGIRINTFLKSIRNEAQLGSLPIVVYGEEISFLKIENKEDIIYFSKQYEYSELKKFLSTYIDGQKL